MAAVKSKKIIFLVTQSEMGGAQRYIYEVSRALAGRYEILVAAGEGDGELFEKIRSTKFEIRNIGLKNLKRAPNPIRIISAIAEITRLLKEERPDVLFLCSTTAGLLGSIAARIYRGPTSKNSGYREVGPQKMRVIYRIGGWAFRDPRPFWKNWIIFWLEKLTARFKDLIIVNSEYDWRIAVERRIVSPEKIIKIYNGIDVNSLKFLPREEARQKLSKSGLNSPWIGCVANFYRTKGLEYLIEALRYLSQLNCHQCDNGSSTAIITAIIIGDGRERPKLENLIKKYNLENKVILAGRISDAYKYLKAFDVFTLPSLKEGFPWIILEAMAAELPIIATDVGALPEIIENGKEGFLVEPKNSRALAEKIKWLLKHPQEAKVMGIQAKAKLVKKFSLQAMVKETEKLLLNQRAI